MSLVNTNLEKEFNLAPQKEQEKSEESPLAIIESSPKTLDCYEKIDKIEKALPQVDGLNASDKEFDELAEYGIRSYKDLMDLSLNIEERFASDVASAASNMLGHAINARTNKIKKKLDMIELQIKKQVADFKTSQKNKSDDAVIEGKGELLDRNELLKHLLQKSK
ncbi:Uncharacterised protein [uncultured archaeon]|nr:Uncharacterised protein [uncultured archaeon]